MWWMAAQKDVPYATLQIVMYGVRGSSLGLQRTRLCHVTIYIVHNGEQYHVTSHKAIIEKNGTVRLLEPIQLNSHMRAVITLLEPLEKQGNSRNVLELLQSPAFQNVPANNPVELEATILANRNAWENTRMRFIWIHALSFIG